jgi:flagellar FliL protein
MSAAAASAGLTPSAAKKGSKKLLVLIVSVVLLLALAGGGAFHFMKKKAVDEDSADAEDAAPKAKAAAVVKKDAHKNPPTFVALDPFVVNLADRERERYAQIGITLEVDDAHVSDELKAYMPAIRSAILMTLSHKTSEELLSREGKEQLAAEILRESVRPLGIDIDAAASAPPGKKKRAEVYNPVKQVNFSNFIIQ